LLDVSFLDLCRNHNTKETLLNYSTKYRENKEGYLLVSMPNDCGICQKAPVGSNTIEACIKKPLKLVAMHWKYFRPN